MFANHNAKSIDTIDRYMMMPGDGTKYRFGYSRVSMCDNPVIIGDGVTMNPSDYIWFYVDMRGGCGVSIVHKSGVRQVAREPHIIGYLQGKGMDNVDEYTLIAVLLALSVLIDEPSNLEDAAKKMLNAGHILMGVKMDN